MKEVTNKNIMQKIAITILIVLSFNFITPTFSRADFGGVLLGPVIDLVAGLGDSIMNLLQYFMEGTDLGIFKSLEVLNPLGSKALMIDEKNFKEDLSDDDKKKLGLLVETDEDGKVKGNIKEIMAKDLDQGWFGWGRYAIPVIQYSPEKIFSNQIPALDANFINPKDWDDDTKNNKSIARQLQSTISSWYQSLRNLVLVSLLAILLYVAIRVIISSTASDKAKYKQMLLDWLVALCLLFFLHYIMSFTMTLVEIITESIGNGTEVIVHVIETDGATKDIYFKTNLMGLCRMQITHVDLGTKTIYLIFYIAIIIYTFKFTFEYIKRAITLAFLTLMAPLVTLTYPIDKMGDGKAQAFNAWLKEFVFNALLQPFHLIVYTIFMGAGMNIAVDNPLYAIFFLAFLTPAEKLLKKFFGFDKASSAASSFAGGFGGAAAFSAVKGAVSKGASMLSGNSGGSKGGNSGGNVRTKKTLPANTGPDGLAAFSNTRGNLKESSENNKSQKNNIIRRQEKEALEEKIANGEIDKSDLTKEQRDILQSDNNNLGNAFGSSSMSENIEGQDPIRMQEKEALEEKIANGEIDKSDLTKQQRELIGIEEPNKPRELIGIEEPNKQRELIGIEEPNKPRVIKGVIGAVKGTGRYIGHNLRNRFATKEGWKRNGAAALRFVGRTAARTVGLGIGATVGLAAGITGDGLEDVIKYGAAGTALGAKTVGDGIIGAGKRIANSNIVQAARQGAREDYYGGVKEAQAAQTRSQLKANGELREYIGNNITDENGQRLSNKALTEYEDRAIDHYNAGITDNSEIKKTLKLEDSIRKELAEGTNLEEKERNDLARQQSETIAKYAEQFNGDKFETNEEYRAKKREEFAVGIRRVNPNLSESQIKKNSEQMIKRICEYKKITYRND